MSSKKFYSVSRVNSVVNNLENITKNVYTISSAEIAAIKIGLPHQLSSHWLKMLKLSVVFLAWAVFANCAEVDPKNPSTVYNLRSIVVSSTFANYVDFFYNGNQLQIWVFMIFSLALLWLQWPSTLKFPLFFWNLSLKHSLGKNVSKFHNQLNIINLGKPFISFQVLQTYPFSLYGFVGNLTLA